MIIQENSFYSYKQLRELLGIGKVASEKLIKSGQLTPKKPGKSYIFSGAQIIEYLNSEKGAQQ